MWIILFFIHQFHIRNKASMDINIDIRLIFERFPPFFAEKRYKLIKFAPNYEIVDKLS